ncbi:MAG: hypothetical protein Q4C91_20085, partial [Eubacteriales bacterium]|nr:hypothetical protein [Eubacteriales bacterium]
KTDTMKTGRRMKMAVGIAAAGMVMAAALPAAAEENNTMTVKYTEASTYTLKIPETVTLKENEVVTASVGLSAINVGANEAVGVRVKSGISGGKVTLTDENDATNTVSSTVSLTEDVSTGIKDNEVVAVFAGTSTTAVEGGTLYFSELGNVSAGTYSGTIVFEAGIEKQQTEEVKPKN